MKQKRSKGGSKDSERAAKIVAYVIAQVLLAF